jgi:hypothetical protein
MAAELPRPVCAHLGVDGACRRMCVICAAPRRAVNIKTGFNTWYGFGPAVLVAPPQRGALLAQRNCARRSACAAQLRAPRPRRNGQNCSLHGARAGRTAGRRPPATGSEELGRDEGDGEGGGGGAERRRLPAQHGRPRARGGGGGGGGLGDAIVVGLEGAAAPRAGEQHLAAQPAQYQPQPV